MGSEDIAKICYAANKAYCEIIKEEVISWEQCKHATIKGVEDFNNDTHISCWLSHQKWVDNKIKDGWKYGPTKDYIKKEHPCIRDWHDLPLTQRFKDILFLSICRCFNGV